ncbi:hypothetical protein LG401_09060 [Bacillus pumilus]|uniref:BclA C-terminal domain-containing protein n=1 Tax=Bacillus pumilus TaxID=1408 RepID=UPI001CFA4CA7|nr:hypothetical protein LG401_09060 [Bacillus pumilus]
MTSVAGTGGFTDTALYAANSSGPTIVTVAGGTNIPLPNFQNITGFTANGTSTVFTVLQTDKYYITYQVNTTAALLINTCLLLNGATTVPSSVQSPVISTSFIHNTVIVNLTAGSIISLQFFWAVATAVLVGGGAAAGAALTIIRLS